MRALVATVLLASCSSPEATTTSEDVRPDPWDTPAVIFAPPKAVPVKFTHSNVVEPIALPTPRGLVSAIPGEPIRAIAVTEDGRAAVTSDQTQSARLWPTLDGKREPVIVTMHSATALALARHGEQFVIAGLDAAGQLELVVTKSSGESIQRLAIDAERPFVTIHAVDDGFLVLDDTRAIRFIDFAGMASLPLVAGAEEHVVSLATRGALVLAIIDRGGSIHGRWVEVGSPPRWGAETPSLPIDATSVAISADGKRLGGASPNGMKLAIYNLETGKRVKTVVSDGERLAPITFVKGVLAYAEGNRIAWSDGGHETFGEPVTFGGSHLVAAIGAALVLATPRETAYVGYRMNGPGELVPIGDHYLAADQKSVVELDRRFRTTKVHELPTTDPQQGWYGIHIFDERRVIAGANTGSSRYLIDLVSHAVSPLPTKGWFLGHERATGLIAYRTNEQIDVMQLDASGVFAAPASIEIDTRTTQFFLLDPKRAEGNVAAIVAFHDGKATVTALRSLKFGETDKPYEVGSEREIELPATWWDNDRDFVKLLPATWLPPSRLASPDGKYAVELREDERIRLTDARGKQVWTIPRASAQQVTWSPSGDLIAFGSGVARIDLATGALVTRQCGWRFGRWDAQPEASMDAGLCVAR
jgi:WD40 repeat protein